MAATRQHTYSGKIKISRSDMTLLRAGRKRCTLRMGKAAVATPEILMSDGRVSIRVRILKVDTSRTFKEISLQDALDEGFSSRDELIEDLRQYYPRAVDDDPITVIYFEQIGLTPSLFD